MTNNVNNLKDAFNRELQELAQKRDELRVQIALGSKEAREEWELLEEKYFEFEQKVKVQNKAMRETINDSIETLQKQTENAKNSISEFLNSDAEKELSNLADNLKSEFSKLKSKIKQ